MAFEGVDKEVAIRQYNTRSVIKACNQTVPVSMRCNAFFSR